MKNKNFNFKTRRRDFFEIIGAGVLTLTAFSASPFKGLAKNLPPQPEAKNAKKLNVQIHPLAIQRNKKV